MQSRREFLARTGGFVAAAPAIGTMPTLVAAQEASTEPIHLPTEIAFVLHELRLFEHEIIPHFSRCCSYKEKGVIGVDGEEDRYSTRPDKWREAVRRLAFLARSASRKGPIEPLRREEFEQFINDPATCDYLFCNGRIHWRIGPFIPYSLSTACFWIAKCTEGLGKDWYRLSPAYRKPLREIEECFLELPPAAPLFNSLCTTLPALADLDPPFARKALDKEFWRRRALKGENMTASRQQEWLKLLDSLIFCCVLNNALLHVIAGLANNNFPEIRHYFNHPDLWGFYTGFIPEYLFAIQMEKVAVLQELAQGRSPTEVKASQDKVNRRQIKRTSPGCSVSVKGRSARIHPL